MCMCSGVAGLRANYSVDGRNGDVEREFKARFPNQVHMSLRVCILCVYALLYVQYFKYK